MKKRILSVVVILGLLGAVTPASAVELLGVELEFDARFGLGLNSCVSDGDAKCDDIGSSVSLLLAPGVRFLDYFGLYLDINIGWLSPDDKTGVDSLSTVQIMPVFRGIYIIDGPFPIEVFGGLGAGYSRMATALKGGGDGTWSSFLNPKLNAGATYRLTDKIGVGLNIDFIFNNNILGAESCFNEGPIDQCEDLDSDDDQSEIMQILILGSYLF